MRVCEGCQTTFTPRKATQRFCRNGCYFKHLPGDVRVRSRRTYSRRSQEDLEDQLARLTKRSCYLVGRARGYQAGRRKYHYRRVLEQLLALVQAALPGDENVDGAGSSCS